MSQTSSFSSSYEPYDSTSQNIRQKSMEIPQTVHLNKQPTTCQFDQTVVLPSYYDSDAGLKSPVAVSRPNEIVPIDRCSNDDTLSMDDYGAVYEQKNYTICNIPKMYQRDTHQPHAQASSHSLQPSDPLAGAHAAYNSGSDRQFASTDSDYSKPTIVRMINIDDLMPSLDGIEEQRPEAYLRNFDSPHDGVDELCMPPPQHADMYENNQQYNTNDFVTCIGDNQDKPTKIAQTQPQANQIYNLCNNSADQKISSESAQMQQYVDKRQAEAAPWYHHQAQKAALQNYQSVDLEVYDSCRPNIRVQSLPQSKLINQMGTSNANPTAFASLIKQNNSNLDQQYHRPDRTSHNDELHRHQHQILETFGVGDIDELNHDLR